MKAAYLLLVIALITTASCTKKISNTTVSQSPVTISAQKLYAQGCARCHGATGVEGGAPNLALFMPGTERIAEIIANGKGRMPSFEDDYTGEEIAAIAGYVNNFKTK